MYTDPILFAKITDSNKGIRLPWIGDETDTLFKRHGYHTGLDLYANHVYSFTSGVVTSIGKEDSHYAVTVQYDAQTSLRYLHLKTISVGAGQIVQQGFNLGTADQYVHFEYITKNKKDSLWSVRIGTETYYKHNPFDIIGGEI